MENRKFYTCCFTGHRPNKLPWGYKERGIKFLLFKIRLENNIKSAIKKGYRYFISGMALGSDIICAEIVLKLKKKHPHIELECALPCINQTEKWVEDSICSLGGTKQTLEYAKTKNINVKIIRQ